MYLIQLYNYSENYNRHKQISKECSWFWVDTYFLVRIEVLGQESSAFSKQQFLCLMEGIQCPG